MKISYNWLKEYIDFDKSPEELANDLSLFGHEVENIEKIGDDYILDFEITPNRGDCLSILGMAREIAALYNLELKTKIYELKETRLNKNIDVKIENPQICPRFTARIIDNVEIKDSPAYVKEKLASYGFRSLNNIVDITNYAMIETGQPLHAFDFDKIKDGLMGIRKSKNGEEVMTLDGVNRVLPEGAIIIEDSEKIYDLAGIMGGIKSEIDEKTKTIILQGAIFDPVLIRRTSKKLKHTTDASYRYERGVDNEGTINGVDAATALIQENCPEAKAGELIDIKSKEIVLNKIELDINKINHLIGIDINETEAQEYLERLSFKIDNNITTVPSFRNYDVKIWQDLAEEIARVYGYNQIEKLNIKNPEKKTPANSDWQKREAIKDILVGLGFVEIYSYSFAEKQKVDLLKLDAKGCIEISNPLSPETQFLRPSILPSLLAQAAKNPWSPDVPLFEIEKVFENDQEKWQLGLITLGKSDKMLPSALQGLNLQVEPRNIEQSILDAYKIRRAAKVVVVDINNIEIEPSEINYNISEKKYKKISRFAPSVRDISILVDESIHSESVKQEIYKIDDKIFLVELFDEFISPKLGVGKKNIAYHVWLQDEKGPVEEIITNEIFEKIVQTLEIKFKAVLRS